jgi:hypothetical protein
MKPEPAGFNKGNDMGKPLKKQTKRVKATDEWFPCFENSEVEVSVVQDSGNIFRVCVWGADDTGMERSFEYRGAARECYANIPEPLSMELLKALGFVAA